MKKTWKLLLLALVVALLVGTFTILAFSEADAAEPSLQIKEFSLSLENAVYMNFKVSGENIKDVSEIKLLAWDEAPASYQKDTAEYVLATKGTEEETGYEQFQYTNLAAKDMTKMVYACAYYTDGETEVYSSPVKFSVAMYADMQKTAADPDEGLIVLIDQMLEYGAAAQTYFNYNIEFLATDEVHMVRVVNGKLSDGFTLGWYQEGAQITMTANEPAEGYAFSHWENSAGEAVGTEETVTVSVTKVDTYTAVYEEEISYFLYTELSDGTYGISANPEATLPAELVIPATYNDKAVTQIEPHGFSDQTTLTAVIIPDSVRGIGYMAFNGCTSLTSIIVDTNNPNYKSVEGNLYSEDGKILVMYASGKTATSFTIPDGVTRLGNSAFGGCTSLTSVTIGDSVTSIGNSAFQNCSGLTSVTIGDGVTSIGNSAFIDCSGLTSITIPDSVTSIGSGAFCRCASLTSVTIGYSVTSIGDNAFIDCTNLTSVVISDSVTSIGSGAFRRCTSLTSVTIGDSVTSIGDNAFEDCTNLTSVVIPDSVTSINSWAFYDCTNLTSIVIPDSVTSIRGYAFRGCKSLTDIYFTGTEEEWNAIEKSSANIPATATIHYNYVPESDSSLFTFTELSDGTYSVKANPEATLPAELVIPSTYNGKAVTQIAYQGFYGQTGLTSVTIPDSVTSIWGYVFGDCSNLTSATIGNSVTHIGSYVFSNCSNLTKVTIPESVTYIDSHAFYKCSNLTSVTIPNSVTSIGAYAFQYCSSLTNVTIPESVKDISSGVFSGCNSLTNVTLPDSLMSIGNQAFNECSSLTNVTIPDSVTRIGNFAFYGCSSLTSITIPDSVTSIGEHAFYCCDRLASVTIGNGVTSIGNNVFAGCISLTSITIPDSVTSIGGYAFSGCSKLTSVTIPDSITSIGGYAFRNCDSLTSVYISDLKAWCEISFFIAESNPLYNGADLYLNGTKVTDLYIPDSVTSIGKCAFSGCSSLTSIRIPDSVTSIGKYAFYSCNSLTNITIGNGVTIDNGVTSIGEYAFQDCSSLISVTIDDSVRSIGDFAFDGCSSLTNITIADSVTSIGSCAFQSCKSLTDIYFTGTADEWNAIEKENAQIPTTATIHYNYVPESE